ncbi:MAG: hypothetical protein AB1656_05115 [Candidatus Omnitrophota bacterium]
MDALGSAYGWGTADIEAISLTQAADLLDAIERREAAEGLKQIGIMASAIGLCFSGKKTEPPLVGELKRIAEGRGARGGNLIDLDAFRETKAEAERQYPQLFHNKKIARQKET